MPMILFLSWKPFIRIFDAKKALTPHKYQNNIYVWLMPAVQLHTKICNLQ